MKITDWIGKTQTENERAHFCVKKKKKQKESHSLQLFYRPLSFHKASKFKYI